MANPPMTAPLKPRPEALDFLLSRRSRPAKTLAAPGPDRETLRRLLTAAARTPDHGKLEPWRFVVIEGAALSRVADALEARAAEAGLAPAEAAKAASGFRQAPCVVAVASAPKPSDKIPEWEQALSAGAACLQLLNAALAAGWGANWLTGWGAYDRPFLERTLGLSPAERIAGFIHIGAETVPAPERPRPDPDAVATWLD
jgi:nitroreductase